MKCPDCQTQLHQFDYKGVRIDECPKCKGRWFDRGELKTAKDRTDDDLRWLDFDPFGAEADRYAVASSKTLLCPNCSTRMTPWRIQSRESRSISAQHVMGSG